jgi:hypothetical protein
MAKSKKGTIKLGIYETTIDIHIVEKAEDIVAFANKLVVKHNGLAEDDGSICNGYAIMIEEDPLKGYLLYCKEALTVNVITHETDHMRKYILDFKDIEDHEASANLNAYLNQEVFRFIKKCGFEITY